MLAGMSARQLFEWREYYAITPFGAERTDAQFAILCTLVANALSGKGRSFKMEDFMIGELLGDKPRRKVVRQDWRAIKAAMMMATGHTPDKQGA